MNNSNYNIAIIQMGRVYFWVLRQVTPYKVMANSKLIAEKSLVEVEADKVAKDFGLPVFVEERK